MNEYAEPTEMAGAAEAETQAAMPGARSTTTTPTSSRRSD